MAWDLTWGDREEVLLAAEAQLGKTPDALRNKPRLWPWLDDYYAAFWLLDAGRTWYEGSVGYIPLTELTAYCEMFGVKAEDRRVFVKMMRALDAVYVPHMNAEIRRQIEQARRDAESERGR